MNYTPTQMTSPEDNNTAPANLPALKFSDDDGAIMRYIASELEGANVQIYMMIVIDYARTSINTSMPDLRRAFLIYQEAIRATHNPIRAEQVAANSAVLHNLKLALTIE